MVDVDVTLIESIERAGLGCREMALVISTINVI